MAQRKRVYALAGLLSCLAPLAPAHAEPSGYEYITLHADYTPWDVLTRISYSTADLTRFSRHTKVVTSSDAMIRLDRAIRRNKPVDFRPEGDMDVRFYAVQTRGETVLLEYVADRFVICETQSTRCYENDEHTRAWIDAFMIKN